MKANSAIVISVIIPTYNRENMLAMTIESFSSQDYPKDKYEIIVVDNNSSDGTREAVCKFAQTSTVPIKYIFEARQGVHYARNTAARYALGEILYFTDDDMIADPGLLKNIGKVFEMGYKIGAATGRVLPKWEKTPPAWILKYCINGSLSLNDRKEELVIAAHDIGVYSCHQAIARKAFFEGGGFNPENTAGVWLGDGEHGLNLKIKNLGYLFAYTGSSVIHHMIPASRMTQKYLNKRFANQGNCNSYSDFRKNRYKRSVLIQRIGIHAVKFTVSLVYTITKILLFRDSWRINRAYLNHFISRIKYDWRLITDDNWRQLVLRNDWLNE